MITTIKTILDFTVHNIYSIYLVIMLIGSGLFSFFFDTDHNYQFGHYKDYVISFFFSIFNIAFALFLIFVKILHSRYCF
ncbi:MAG: hypothetical protein ACOCZT_00560 [Halanaerobiales bacterium]